MVAVITSVVLFYFKFNKTQTELDQKQIMFEPLKKIFSEDAIIHMSFSRFDPGVLMQCRNVLVPIRVQRDNAGTSDTLLLVIPANDSINYPDMHGRTIIWTCKDSQNVFLLTKKK